MDVLSFGGGVNSTALAILLINEGWRGNIVFADTGAEWPETYQYMDEFEVRWLRPRGYEIIRLHPHCTDTGKYFKSKARDQTLIEYCLESRVIPNPFRRWCTYQWKVRPIDIYAKVHKANQILVGIDTTERHRKVKRHKVRPLVERNFGRKDCKEIVANEGLEIPPKSSCFLCPFQKDWQWRKLWELHPDLFDMAMGLEENAPRTRIAIFPRQKHAILDMAGKTTLRTRRLGYTSQLKLF